MVDIGFLLDKGDTTVNLHRVLRAIWLTPGLSRTAISEALGLDRSTVTKLVAELILRGMVEESALGDSGARGGRKPVFLSLARDQGYVLGIEIQTERYSAVALNLEGKIAQSRSIPFSWDGKQLSTVFLEIVSEATRELNLSGEGLLGIGVGLSGIVDSATGVIRQSLPLGVTSPLDFYSSSARLIGKPLCIDNDANCCCWAQLVRGRAARPREFLFILGEFRKERAGDQGGGGLSVGMGLVLGGRVHLGASSSAGEFRSVFRVSETGSQFSVDPATMQRAGEDGKAFRMVARELGRNVALLVNTLDLSHVFVGGSIERRRDELVPILEEEIQANWPYGRKSLSIEASELGELVVAYGAGAMFLERLFSLPQIQEHSLPVEAISARA